MDICRRLVFFLLTITTLHLYAQKGGTAARPDSMLIKPMQALAKIKTEPKREFRAAWIATVENIDWPSRPGLSTDQQTDIEKLKHISKIG